ncbi:MAG TPA: M12 family metallo-peptidase [Terriglobia bacterium]|nr:M12 family metallo-peptidase [Terriglobia bacterium]
MSDPDLWITKRWWAGIRLRHIFNPGQRGQQCPSVPHPHLRLLLFARYALRASFTVFQATFRRGLRCFTLVLVILFLGTRVLGASNPPTYPNPIERFVSNYEVRSLEIQRILQQVKSHQEISLAVGGRELRLALEPRDLRSPRYRAEALMSNGKSRRVASLGVQSYLGEVKDIQGAQARFTLREDSLDGVILTPEDWYFVEPLSRYSAAALPSEFVVYRRSDLKPEAFGSCGVNMIEKISQGLEVLAPIVHEHDLNGLVAQIATEADWEYVTGLGGSAESNNEILNILNQVEGVYQTELSISLQVVFQHTWETSSEPYSSTAPSTLLQEFTDYWNSKFSDTDYDLAHLWTGKDMDGSTVGIAWRAAVCTKEYSYGISQKMTGNPAKFILTAHEMGHNFGASHPDQENPPHTECSTSIMNSRISTDFSFCQFSRDQINNYLFQHSSCLTPGAEPAAPSNLSATAISSSQILLSWQDNSSDESSFKLHRKAGSNGSWGEIAATGANATSYTDTGLSGNTTYSYRVQASNNSGDSPFSNEASATTLSALPSVSGFSPTSAPVGSRVTITGSNFTGATLVKFNTTAASSFNVDTDKQISAMVPDGATNGPISVTTPAGTVSSSTNFLVSACAYSVSPTSQSFPASGGSGRLNISTVGGCSWTAASNPGWISINSSKSGTGSGMITYQVASNPGPVLRTGTVTVGDRSATISEAPGQNGGTVAKKIFLPIVLSSAGMNGSFFTSELTLTNNGSLNSLPEFTYTSAIGSGSGHAQVALEAGRQQIIPDAISYLRSLGIPIPSSGNQGGTLQIAFTGLSSLLDASASARITTPVKEGRAGLAYNGITPENVLSGPSFLCGLRQNSTDRSNVAIQNAGSSSDGDITLKLTVFSGDASSPFTKELPLEALSPGGFKQISGILTSNGLSLSNGYVRVERVSGSAPYYAYAVINDQVTSDGSFIPPMSDGSLVGKRRQTLPVIVESGVFSSELIVTNWSGSQKTLVCDFVADAIQASDATATFGIQVGAGEQLLFPNFVQALRDRHIPGIGAKGPAFVGSLFVEVSTGDLSGLSVMARTSSPGGGGHFGLFYGSLPEGTTCQGSTWIYGLQQNEKTRTNLALVNTGELDSSSTTFKIELFDGESGTKVNTLESITLNSRRWMQIGTILSQYATGTAQGFARITKTAGTNPFIVYAVINDGAQPGQGTGDGAFLLASP